MASKQYPYCLHPGRLRQRITLEAAATPTDGETNPTYSTVASNIPAEVLEVSGGEYIRGRQVEAGLNAVITIRYRSDVTVQHRVKYGTRYLNIVSVKDPTGYRSEMVLDCKEVQP